MYLIIPTIVKGKAMLYCIKFLIVKIGFGCNSEAYEGQKYWGAEYRVAVRPQQGRGCGKGEGGCAPSQAEQENFAGVYGNNTV